MTETKTPTCMGWRFRCTPYRTGYPARPMDCGRSRPEDCSGRSSWPWSESPAAALPPENATGNFTKIVQRVPVRILLDPADGVLGHLRPGLSVTAEVDTRKAAETHAVASAP